MGSGKPLSELLAVGKGLLPHLMTHLDILLGAGAKTWKLLKADWPYVLSERFVFEMSYATAVFGDDVAISAKLVLVGG